MDNLNSKKTRKIAAIFLILLALFLFSLLIDKNLASGILQLRSPAADKIILFASFGWNDLSFFLLLVAVILILFLRKDKIKNLKNVIAASSLALVITYGLKFLIGRMRPINSLNLSEPIAVFGSSFPSAHATAVFALLPFIWKEYPRIKWLWLFYSLFIIFSRLWFAAHYLSDTIGGIIIGLSVGILVLNIGQKNKQ
jgi:undecaprenyl-diphosphatase